MRVRLSAATFWRYPEAFAVNTDSGWAVEMGGVAEGVLPFGVDVARDADGRPFGNRPERLDVTLYDIHERLRHVAVCQDGEQAARVLEQHCRLYPTPKLCATHGLPYGHLPCPDFGDGKPTQLKVEHAIAMVTGLDGVCALAYYLANQRRPARRALVENALAWPILDDSLTATIRAEMDRDGALSIASARHLVTRTMTDAMSLSGLQLVFEWLPSQRPAMALRAGTDTAAYVGDFVRHIGASTERDRSVTCAVCGQPYMPRRTPQPGAAYCTASECQRERRRVNKARQRARDNAREGQGNG